MASAYGSRSTGMEVTYGIDLTGRLAIVTGANSGIGMETTRVLALRGAHVIMACRNLELANEARQQLMGRSEGRISEDRLEVQHLDLGKLQTVQDFAQRFIASKRRLHLLINNAGVMLGKRRETEDGLEAQFGINHLGHFYLTHQLLDTLEASGPARIVNVASEAMKMADLNTEFRDLDWTRRRYSWMKAYGNSKLMNLMFTRELDRRVGPSGVIAHCVHPGVIPTRLARDAGFAMMAMGVVALPFMKTVAQGAATTLFAATSQSFADRGGVYFSNCKPLPGPPLAQDADACSALWDLSVDRVRKFGLPITPALTTSGAQPLTN